MRKVTKSKISSTVCRRNLVTTILRKEVEIRPYINCIKIGERYIADRVYNKYANYVKNTKTSYNLIISQDNWDKLNNKRTRLSELLKK